MKIIILTGLFLALFGCSNGSDSAASSLAPNNSTPNQHDSDSNNTDEITNQTAVVLRNRIISAHLAYNDLADAYKNHIFPGASLTTKIVNNGYVMEINKTDEITDKNVRIQILFNNHLFKNITYLLATRVVVDGKEGSPGDLIYIIRDRLVSLCVSQPTIPYCKDIGGKVIL
jgi:hypothetical protein